MVDDLLKAGAHSVLDVGCGTGLLARSFHERGLDVLGVEPDAAMAAVARGHRVAGAKKAADGVVHGGAAAHVWNIGGFDDDLGAELNDVYARMARGHALPLVPHRRERAAERTASEDAMVAAGFAGPTYASYPWEQTYTTAEWLAQLETHSDHALMAPKDRATLLAAVADVLDARGGS